eukprot:COSAG06_NODE_14508_length_1150_cov_3.954329_1_plen_263_part_00
MVGALAWAHLSLFPRWKAPSPWTGLPPQWRAARRRRRRAAARRRQLCQPLGPPTKRAAAYTPVCRARPRWETSRRWHQRCAAIRPWTSGWRSLLWRSVRHAQTWDRHRSVLCASTTTSRGLRVTSVDTSARRYARHARRLSMLPCGSCSSGAARCFAAGPVLTCSPTARAAERAAAAVSTQGRALSTDTRRPAAQAAGAQAAGRSVGRREPEGAHALRCTALAHHRRQSLKCALLGRPPPCRDRWAECRVQSAERMAMSASL